ncbi:hypothetical protein BDV39DRAFT_187536 [Aspergillus sergii]|uniref:Uncharacterized protein n=1 Tax=Aspergillus sergii TaxID=1034303 RepID=A0A5N6WM41_9EURO|nr:hypothetical protein BDV39DRAFT_187536 [Aspergillus sergii]
MLSGSYRSFISSNNFLIVLSHFAVEYCNPPLVYRAILSELHHLRSGQHICARSSTQYQARYSLSTLPLISLFCLFFLYAIILNSCTLHIPADLQRILTKVIALIFIPYTFSFIHRLPSVECISQPSHRVPA